MLNKGNFFINFYSTSSKFNNNLKKTKIFLNNIKSDLKNIEIPLLHSFSKDYIFDFTTDTVKKFSKYKNIILIGMGGSILGAKCIYSFLKSKIKKEILYQIQQNIIQFLNS